MGVILSSAIVKYVAVISAIFPPWWYDSGIGRNYFLLFC